MSSLFIHLNFLQKKNNLRNKQNNQVYNKQLSFAEVLI